MHYIYHHYPPTFSILAHTHKIYPYTNYTNYPAYFYTQTAMQTSTLLYANGDRYVGQVTTNLAGVVLPHGYGTTTRANGDTHTGYYYEGRRHGQGQSYSVVNQRQYNGGFVYDREEGYATIIRPGTFGGQRQYAGYVANNQRHGEGKQWETSVSGRVTMYEGQWVNDQLVGRGKFIVSELGYSHWYEGNFVNGQLEGFGTYTNAAYGVKYNAVFQGGNVIQLYP
jgi:hypothetical protein